jgi:hypothetical protein
MKKLITILIIILSFNCFGTNPEDTGYLVLIQGHWKIKSHKVKSIEQVESIHQNYFDCVTVDFVKFFERSNIYQITNETVIFYAEKVEFVRKKNGKIKIRKFKNKSIGDE